MVKKSPCFTITVLAPPLAITFTTTPGNILLALVPAFTAILIPLLSIMTPLYTGCGCLPKR